MIRHEIIRLWIAGLVPLLLSGHAVAASEIQGPTSGYVFDASRGQVLPINGRPGGATLGEAVAPGVRLKQAAIAPEGFAVGVDLDGTVLLISSFQAPRASVTQLAFASTSPDLLFLNGAGTAALYWRTKKVAQLVTGLPDNPGISPVVDLSQIPGDISAITSDPTGSYLLVAAGSQGSGGIYRAGADGKSTVQLLVPGVSPVAIQFVHAGKDAAVLDQGANQLFLIQDVLGAAEQQVLAGAKDGLHAPLQLAAGGDGNYFLVGNVGETSVRMVHMQGNFAVSVDAVELPSVPAQLAMLTTDLFLVSAGDDSSRPWYVLDVSATPAAYFIPAAPEVRRRAERGR